ncbi:hypothetical protein NR996_01685 [Lactobacillus rodentium]|uniref:Uncharacterized protein n=1 Tax=Lactobacillus rodentium TaxID=947835 RepID=A0A2Z6T809_9LACO|nr:hypothetical protein [Lactobacillus rodentium]MCR1894123.1 hypothetical protein [Lactobacillus rodentium]GBG04418.1 hypothetical protein LrDSM24759_03320 [Lactobacillus rodentium]
MIDYIKDAWKISGNLNKLKYFGIANILWTIALAFFLYNLVIDFCQGAITPNVTDTLVQLLFAIIIVILTFVLWILNIRFYPFAFKKMKVSTQKIIEESVAQYKEVRNAGPRTFSERPDGTTSADKIIRHSAFKQGEWKVIDNSPRTRQESKVSHYVNAVGNGMGSGLGWLSMKVYFWFLRIMLWPVAFISGLANMGPIVHEYRKTQETNNVNLQ